jgi:hypothetical protein
LPQIQIELENIIQKTRTGLQQLPKPPSSDPIGEVASLLHQFIGELNNIIEGVYHPEGLLQAIRPSQEQFRREIRHTAPDFRPFEEPVEFRMEYEEPFPDPVFLLNEDGEGRQGPHAGKTMPIFIDTVMRRAEEYVCCCLQCVLLSNLFSPSARTRELPGHYPFVVQKSFISEITAKWAAPAEVLCRIVHSTLAHT